MPVARMARGMVIDRNLDSSLYDSTMLIWVPIQVWVESEAVLDLALLVLQQPRKQRRRLPQVIRLYTDGSINLQINGLVKRVLE